MQLQSREKNAQEIVMKAVFIARNMRLQQNSNLFEILNSTI